jgi:hypothetical protein
MPRYAAKVPDNFGSVPLGGGETEFAAQRRWRRSSFEFVTDDDASAPLDLRSETMSRGRPQATHYLFNSMPCAYAWFHH